jgi:D-3-phosphoglycerate dehydrogenase
VSTLTKAEATPAPDWAKLTRQPRKQALYQDEAQVLEAWEDFHTAWGQDVEGSLQRLAVIAFKPESVARGAIPAAVQFLHEHGFTPIASRRVQLTRERCHSMWHYQWNKATVDRTRLLTFIAEQSPWLVVVLRDDEPVAGLPGSVRLWELKGPTATERRHDGHLRTLIGMRNPMIGFVHAPDEPADIVREHGILLDKDERGPWLGELRDNVAADHTAQTMRAAAALEAQMPRHSVAIEEVAERLSDGGSSPHIGDLLGALAAGERRGLAAVREAFGPLTSHQGTWDYIVLAAALIELDRPGVTATLDAAALADVKRLWVDQRQPENPTTPTPTPTTATASARILIVDPVHPHALEALGKRFEVLTHLQPSAEQFMRLIEDVDVVVLRSGVRLTEALLRSAKKLRLVARAGVGVDNIDLESARELGICVFNVPSETSASTAEFTFGLLLAIARKISLADRQLRDDHWRKAELYGIELNGKTLGIVGLGRIGSRVARIAHGFGMTVIACVAHDTPQRRRELAGEGIQLHDLPVLLARSDIISVHVPLLESTQNLIGAPELAMMRESAYLVDVSRGGVVDEDALFEALRHQRIAGAAKDVFVTEGAPTRLNELANVVITPHIGSMTFDAQRRVAERLVQSIIDALEGTAIENRLC